jgi:hypothetical protein
MNHEAAGNPLNEEHQGPPDADEIAEPIADQPAFDAQAAHRPGADHVPNQDVVGRASATESAANTSERFHAWLAPEAIVNPFDIIEVDHLEDSRTYGLVTEISHTTDAASHLANLISSDFGDVNVEPQTPRQGADVLEADVLANSHPGDPARTIYMPVRNGSPVRFADELGIQIALGFDRIEPADRIPAGVVRMTNGTIAPVFLNRQFLLGPEGAHVNITGLSGLATKTSFATVLIQSILQRSDDVAVIMLNVKQNDLLVVDRPSQDLHDNDRVLYDAMGIEPLPFRDVRYLIPLGRHGRAHCYGQPPANHQVYGYSLRDVTGNVRTPGPGTLSLFSNMPDEYGTLTGLCGEVDSQQRTGTGPFGRVPNWEGLMNGQPIMVNGEIRAVSGYRADSVGRFRRLLVGTVQTRQSGIFVPNRNRDTVNLGQEIRNITRGQTVVVDIYNLTDAERSLVFGHIIQEVHRMYSEADFENDPDMPRKMVIFVDELNKYAPARSRGGAVLDDLLDISGRGRSMGVILLGAEQFMSEVHTQVAATSTKVMGRSDPAELSDAAYRVIPQDLRQHLVRLEKGEMVISHPMFRKPVRILVPRPAYGQIGH